MEYKDGDRRPFDVIWICSYLRNGFFYRKLFVSNSVWNGILSDHFDRIYHYYSDRLDHDPEKREKTHK